MGNQMSTRGGSTETAKFTQNPTTKVFTEDGREVTPGSDEIGVVAAGGFVPIGYFKDPDKSARTSARSTACATRSPATSPRSPPTAR